MNSYPVLKKNLNWYEPVFYCKFKFFDKFWIKPVFKPNVFVMYAATRHIGIPTIKEIVPSRSTSSADNQVQ